MIKMLWSVLIASCSIFGQEVQNQIGVRSFLAPTYPTIARAAQIQGEVRLGITIDTDGKIVSVDSSSGPEILVAGAKANVYRWSYTPVDHSTKLTIIYSYQLRKPEMEREPVPTIELETPFHVIISSNLPRVDE